MSSMPGASGGRGIQGGNGGAIGGGDEDCATSGGGVGDRCICTYEMFGSSLTATPVFPISEFICASEPSCA
eukprot:7360642-Prymnesium_polylepis.3